MQAVVTTALRLPLTPPQAVSHTSACLWQPAGAGAGTVVVLAHGAGSDMTSALIRTVGRGLAQRGFPVAAFNFAYAEAGRRRPDPPAHLEGAFRDVLAAVGDRLGPGRPVVLAGRSLGGRIASHLAAQGQPCTGLVLLCYPLHAAGRPERLRSGHWSALRVPVLFVSGDRDRLCDLELLQRERAQHLGRVPHRLHLVAGGDHSLAVRRSDGRPPDAVHAEVVGAVAAWLRALPQHAPRAGAGP